MTDLDDLDDLCKLLEKYGKRWPSDAAKRLIKEAKSKRDELIREAIL